MTGHRKPWEFDGTGEDRFGDTDPRPYWERLDPAQGLPAWEALYHFVDQGRARELYELERVTFGIEDYDDPRWFPEERDAFLRDAAVWRSPLSTLTSRLEGNLRHGHLEARGFSSQAPLDAPRRGIAPERWRDLELDAQNSTASGSGIVVTQILIYRPKAKRAGAALAGAKAYSAAALRRWYIKRVETCRAAGSMPSREADYRDANAAFAGDVPKREIEGLRRELAPSTWTRRGRRPGA